MNEKIVFDIEVTNDAEDGYFMAVCDGLCLATEAPSYEALVERVWLVAPELAAANKVAPEGGFDLRFVHLTHAMLAAE